MLYLNENFEFGVIDKLGNKYFDSNSNEFESICKTQWKLRSVDSLLKEGIGHCYDQVEIERDWFLKNVFVIKNFWVSVCQQGEETSRLDHSYLVYKDNNFWKLFEHSDSSNRVILKFNSLRNAVICQTKHPVSLAKEFGLPQKAFSIRRKEYRQPPTNLKMEEFLQFIDKANDYVL